MRLRAMRGWGSVGVALVWLAAAVPCAPSEAVAQPAYVVQPVVEMRVKALPAGPLFWRIERFDRLAEARAAAGPTSLAAEIGGQAWLFTLGPQADGAPGGHAAVEIGPVPPVSAPEYLLRVNYVGGPPGARTAVHTHPGSETFYVLTGQLGQQTPDGEMRVDAGQSMAGHGAGMPMQVFSSGASDLTAIVLFVVDATKPFSSPATFR